MTTTATDAVGLTVAHGVSITGAFDHAEAGKAQERDDGTVYRPVIVVLYCDGIEERVRFNGLDEAREACGSPARGEILSLPVRGSVYKDRVYWNGRNDRPRGEVVAL